MSIFSRREALNLVDIGLSLSFYGAAALSIYAESPDFGKISGDYTFNIFYKLFPVISLGIFQAQKPMKSMNKSYIFKSIWYLFIFTNRSDVVQLRLVALVPCNGRGIVRVGLLATLQSSL